MSSAVQLCFPGMEPWRRVRCRPRLADLKRLFLWCKSKWKEIRVSQQWLADQLKVSLSTVRRWMTKLAPDWVKVNHRGPRTSVYEVVEELEVPRDREIASECPSSSYPLSESFGNTHRRANPKVVHWPGGPRRKGVSRSMSTHQIAPLDEPFREFLQIFWDRGKPMNAQDAEKAFAIWVTLSVSERIAAMHEARRVCAAVSQVQYVPRPDRYLADRAWTREANPNPNGPITKADASAEALRLAVEARKRQVWKIA